jgi:hypothetical protein
MFKFYRSVLAAGVVALGLAACGDDVTVTNPPPPPAGGVTSVTVTPANASVGIGQQIQLAASVVADSGVSTDLNWTSSSDLIATVSGTGLVTGVGLGTTTIVATSVANSARSFAVQITVTSSATFTIAPSTMTLAPGQSSSATASLNLQAGQTAPATAIVWASLSSAIATVPASCNSNTATTGSTASSVCAITGVSQGTAVITATATIAGQSFTQTINVTVGSGASISLQGVTQGASFAGSNCPGVVGAPVVLTNVACQIEVGLNLNAGTQALDSLVIFIKQGAITRSAAKQVYGNTIPSTGPVNLSITTSEFTKNPAAGTAVPKYFNGPTSLIVQVFPHLGAGGSVVDCQTGASDPTCTGVSSMIFNNVDGWAADITKPTNSATDVGGSATNAGNTYWGGPGTTGQATAEIYAVVYNDNPAFPAGSSQNRCSNTLGNGTGCITSVTWTVGSPSVGGAGTCGFPASATQTALPFKQVFGNGTGATNACVYENTTAIRDNIVITNAIDGQNNPFSLVGTASGLPLPANPNTTLIPNIVAAGGTPDSLRLDYVGPNNVTAPLIGGAAGFNWVNAVWVFKPTGTIVTDLGVGPLASSWAAFAGPASGVTYPTPIVTGADLAETNTNSVLDGFRARATATDRLGNSSNSTPATPFGVDKTMPSIRYATTAELTNVKTYTLPADTFTVVAAPAAGSPQTLWAVDAIDNRSGLYTTPLTGVLKGVDQTVIKLVTGTPLQNNVSVAGDDAYIPGALIDGYRQTVAVPVWGSAVGQTNATTGYYTYTVTVRDEAGNSVTLSNATGAIAQRRYAIDNAAPVATGLTMPFTFGSSALTLAGTFQFAASDDLEVISAILGINPGAIPNAGQPIVFPALTVGTKYDGTLAGDIATIANLTTPVLASVSTPDFWAGVQVLCDATNACTDGSTDLGGPIVAGATIQPVSVFANAVDVFGTASAATTSNILPGSLPATTELTLNLYDGVGSISSANGIQVRYQPSVSATTVRQVSNFSVTLPQLARLDLFKLVAGQWVYQTTLSGSAGVGSDNGLERFWDYNFGSALSSAGTYAVLSFYNGPQAAAVGTALWFTFTK